MTHPELDRIGRARYVRFTTYRSDGTPVATPTWVVREDDKLYVLTQQQFGKVARVKADERAAIAVSDWRGNSDEPDVPVRARLLDAQGTARVKQRAIEKYKGEYRFFQGFGALRQKARRQPPPVDAAIELELLPIGADERGRWRVASGSSYEPLIKFSRAVRVGDTVHVAGTGPILPDGSCPDGAYEQTACAFQIAVAALAELGAGPEHVVRTRMFMTDATEWKDVARAHGEAFGAALPAATMVVVKELLDPAWKIEVEVEAIIR
jgi:PPOX class probable F420-dependent enzyme